MVLKLSGHYNFPDGSKRNTSMWYHFLKTVRWLY